MNHLSPTLMLSSAIISPLLLSVALSSDIKDLSVEKQARKIPLFPGPSPLRVAHSLTTSEALLNPDVMNEQQQQQRQIHQLSPHSVSLREDRLSGDQDCH